MSCIEARNLRKRFGRRTVLDDVSLTLEPGRILGLIGPNGAGKSTLLNAMLGLTPIEGSLRVLGLDPWRERDRLMREVCFISDVAVLPRWMRVSQALDYVGGVHPRFDRARALALLARTSIPLRGRIGTLSKGMVTQLHLALIMAIDARLLVLDEPTLGLDLLFRRQFYDNLLNDYFDGDRSIVITTHQVEEIHHVLTDIALIHHGRIVLQASVDDCAERFVAVGVLPEQLDVARAMGPIHEQQTLGRQMLLFDGVPRAQLAELGELHTPRIADLFVALIGTAPQPASAAA